MMCYVDSHCHHKEQSLAMRRRKPEAETRETGDRTCNTSIAQAPWPSAGYPQRTGHLEASWTTTSRSIAVAACSVAYTERGRARRSGPVGAALGPGWLLSRDAVAVTK